MGNITLSLDESVVKRVRRIALERDTTLTAMVRDYLEQVAASDQALREQQARDIRAAFANYSRPLGGKDWQRDDLYA
jgi:predicted transcriptional regulator